MSIVTSFTMLSKSSNRTIDCGTKHAEDSLRRVKPLGSHSKIWSISF